MADPVQQVPSEFWHAFEDEVEIRRDFWRPGAGETVIDVGSYYGSYTLPALAAEATVIAVEPFFSFSEAMERIAAANGIETHRLTVINKALAGREGYSEEFWQCLEESPYDTIYASRSTPFTTLDSLVDDLGLMRLDWVKIDVEGAELGVLEGGQQTLTRFHPVLLIEDHSKVYPFVAAMNSSRLCLDLLTDLGYDVRTIHYTRHRTPDRDFWLAHASR